MTTFQALGLDFPLFAAPVDEASNYAGAVNCDLCHLPKPHGFRLGIGEDIILPCGTCGTLNALDADDMEDVECRQCGAVVAFPVPEDDDYIHCCTDCLRAGKAAFTHDTEFGMVRWEDTLGDGPHRQFTTADLLELVRTPSYSSWQGERWQFCHGRPMVYLGSWRREDFNKAASDSDGPHLFLETVEDVAAEAWGYLSSSDFSTYIFRCQECGGLKGYWDAS